MNNLLIINCSSDIYSMMPMGTFGLSYLLEQAGVAHDIIDWRSAADEFWPHLRAHVSDYSHIGLILHWKETTPQFLTLCDWLSQNFGGALFCGGLTASYYFEEILRDAELPDVVLRGDCEEPLIAYLKGTSPSRVPNLATMEGGQVRQNPMSFVLGHAAFEEIRFGFTEHLLFGQRYLDGVTSFGLPLPVWRGCPYGCEYCGGSASAFSRTCNRHKAIHRSASAIVTDIHDLFNGAGVRRFYLCGEPNQILLEVYRRLHGDFEQGDIVVSLGAYSPPDAEFAAAYSALNANHQRQLSYLEISPETTADGHRAAVRDPRLAFTNQQIDALIQGLDEPETIILLFYSYFHSTDTRAHLLARRRAVLDLRLRYLGRPDVMVTLLGLSTDPGSTLFEQTPRPVRLRDFHRPLLEHTLGDNINYVFPQGIDRLDALLLDLEAKLHRRFPSLYFALYKHFFTIGHATVVLREILEGSEQIAAFLGMRLGDPAPTVESFLPEVLTMMADHIEPDPQGSRAALLRELARILDGILEHKPVETAIDLEQHDLLWRRGAPSGLDELASQWTGAEEALSLWRAQPGA